MRRMKKWIALVLCLCMFSVSCLALTGCSSVGDGKKIIRIAHSQSETHPEHLGLLKFKEYVEENLGDKYEVQIYPNELLGSQKKAIELTQTGAIDFTLVGTPNLENFADVYEVFSMPYLFTSEEAYHAAMMDTDYMDKIYESTDEAGFRVLTWYDVGSRSFYAKKKIETPADLKGLKIRVQESPASIKMANAFGAAASPMSFGEVYTAIQQGVIDGQENPHTINRDQKFWEVQKYITESHYLLWVGPILVSEKWYRKLDDQTKALVNKAAKQAQSVEWAWSDEQDAIALQECLDHGMVLNKLTDEPVWMEAARSVWPQFYDKVGGKELVDEAVAIINSK